MRDAAVGDEVRTGVAAVVRSEEERGRGHLFRATDSAKRRHLLEHRPAWSACSFVAHSSGAHLKGIPTHSTYSASPRRTKQAPESEEHNVIEAQWEVAVITGGSSGIGLASAIRFVQEGAHVFIMGRRFDLCEFEHLRSTRSSKLNNTRHD